MKTGENTAISINKLKNNYMNAKPILIAKIPSGTFKTKKQATEALNKGTEKIKELTGNEYHVILFFNDEISNPEFEVLNAKNATDTTIEELTDIVKQNFNN